MQVILSPEFEELVKEKIRSGEYLSADDVINAAMQLLKDRDADMAVIEAVNSGEPLPDDERLQNRVAILLDQAGESGPPVEMTDEDWEDIRREGMERIRLHK
jgi:putative addiction module CopG family antidote